MLFGLRTTAGILLISSLCACTSLDTPQTDDGNTAPEIILSGDTTLTLNVGDTYIEPGVTAIDIEDGDLTDKVLSDASALNTHTLGVHSITYQVVDSDGMASEPALRKIIVVDPNAQNHAPIINLIGASNIVLNVGEDFTDLGAEALDIEDGDLSESVVITPSNINTNNAGEYTLTYTVTDFNGATVSTTRQLTITEQISNTPPTLKLAGDNPLQLRFKQVYSEPGFTASDSEDGNLTEQTTVSNNINILNAGNYEVVYTVTDSQGAAVSKTRAVVVADNTPPVITLLDSAPIITGVGTELNVKDFGAIAIDLEDGPVHVAISDIKVNTSVAGEYALLYVAIDAEGLKTILSRDVIVEATQPSPVQFSLMGGDAISIELNTIFEDPGFIAVSREGLNIEDTVTVTGSVNTSQSGSYELHYLLNDENMELTRVVNVLTANCPASCTSGCIQFAENELQCADQSNHQLIDNGLTIEKSQDNCMAPCGIHFKANAIKDFGVSENYHHLSYHWDFGDSGTSFDSLASDFPFSNDANHAQGPYGAHVYAEPGEYTITLRTAAQNGRWAYQTETVTVLPPEQVIPANETVCISAQNQFDDCPIGAYQMTSWLEAADLIERLQNSRVLLRSGESYELPNRRILLRQGRHAWNTYGGNGSAILKLSHPSNILDTWTIDEMSVANMTVEGDYDSATGLGFSWKSSGFYFGSVSHHSNNVTFFNNNISGVHTCFNPRGGTGYVFANNQCTDWYNFGSLADETKKLAYVGNSIKQKLTARSSIGSKSTPYIEHAAASSARTFFFNSSQYGGAFAENASHDDIAVWIIERDEQSNDTHRQLLTINTDYSLDLTNRTVTLTDIPAQGKIIRIEQKRWADHGPIRDADSFELVVSQNDLLSNVGWFANGTSHQAPLRYNTDGKAGHSGVINKNRLQGGDHIMVLEPANPRMASNKGLGLIIERNHLIGTGSTSFGIRSSYGNVTIRSNLFFQNDDTPTFNGYWYSILFWENHSEGNGSDPENFTLPVEIYSNTFINLNDDNQSSDGNFDYIDYMHIANDKDGVAKATVDDSVFTNLTEQNNKVYAPKAKNIAYHSAVTHDAQGLNATFTTKDTEISPGCSDDFLGNLRVDSQGAQNQP